MWNGPCTKLTRPSLDPQAVETVEQLLTDHAPILAPAELQRFAHAVVAAADPDVLEPIDDQLQQERRYVELKQRRDGMWQLQGRLTNTVGAQLNAILDPLTTPRTSSIEHDDGNVIQIPDNRPQMQRLHDALEEACARLLKSGDQPSAGGVPASVIVTISLEELLAKAGLAETADGTQLTPAQLLRIADEAKIWPTIIDRDGVPLALGRTRRLASPGQTMALIARDAGCSFPGCTHPAAWCDRHHILDWILGGPTDLDNLTLLCRYHHTHFCRRAGAAGSTLKGYLNGSHPAGSTKINNPTSTPASDASTPNNNSTAATDGEHRPPHNGVRTRYLEVNKPGLHSMHFSTGTDQ
ncbi:MAG TPA: DUF222 domain-containing protein [Propionibacteriaceae bacterium]